MDVHGLVHKLFVLHRLEAATADALEGLMKNVMEKFEKLKDLNSKKIKLKCSEVQRRIEVSIISPIVSSPCKFSRS